MSPEYNGKSLMVERCGTGGYIAPEIGSKNSLVGPEIDMWSFGVMLYEMCTAYKPTKLCNYRYGKLYNYYIEQVRVLYLIAKETGVNTTNLFKT